MYGRFDDDREKELERKRPESWEEMDDDRNSGINNFEPLGVKDGIVMNKRINDRYIPNKRGCDAE